MTREAPIYDLTLLLDTEADEERRDKIVADVEQLIGQTGGSLVGRHDWGVRDTTYEIHKKTNADYHLIQFYANGTEVLDALSHTLKITDGVNRFRVIKLRPGTPDAPDLRAAAMEEAGEDQFAGQDER